MCYLNVGASFEYKILDLKSYTLAQSEELALSLPSSINPTSAELQVLASSYLTSIVIASITVSLI